jgi:hypothetical protein
LPRQIQALRDASNVQGAIYFSSKSFIKNPLGWNDSLQNNYYYHPALIPPMEWIDSTKPAKASGGIEKLKFLQQCNYD